MTNESILDELSQEVIFVSDKEIREKLEAERRYTHTVNETAAFGVTLIDFWQDGKGCYKPESYDFNLNGYWVRRVKE